MCDAIKICGLVYNCAMNDTYIKTAKFVKGVVGEDDILTDGIPQYAFVGRSNVGKSSIINALTSTNDMARVGKKPGKTTEINFFIANNAFYLADLPGYGFAEASLETREKLRALIIWYLAQSGAKPVRVVLVVDSKVGLTAMDREMLEILIDQRHPCVIAASKIDRLSQSETIACIKGIKEVAPDVPVIACSSKTGRRMRELSEAIFEGVVEGASTVIGTE